MTTPTRWGFMGAGKIAEDFASAITTLLPKTEHEIIAVASSNLKRSEQFAAKFQIKHAFEGYEKVANCPEVDVIYVNNLHTQHLPCVKLALSSGKPVLCEKPLGVNGKEVREMINLAKEKDVFLMEAFWSQCFPIYGEIRKALKEGRIKEPRIVQGIFTIQPDPSNAARLFVKELGGSALLDIGCYLVMLTTMVFNGDRPESIKALAKLNEEKIDVEDIITLKYKNDRYAQLFVSSERPWANQAAIFGKEGQLEFKDINSPSKLVVNNETIVHPLPEVKTQYNYHNSQGLSYEAQHVRECLLKGLKESPFMPLGFSEVIASTMDDIRREIGVVFTQDS